MNGFDVNLFNLLLGRLIKNITEYSIHEKDSCIKDICKRKSNMIWERHDE